jgi:hypothetical protein
MIKARPSHVGFLSFIVALGVLAFVLPSDSSTASAGLYFKYKCGDQVDCWVTTQCVPGAQSREQSYTIGYCMPTWRQQDYCFTASWVCFEVYSCPDQQFLGRTYEPNTCDTIY